MQTSTSHPTEKPTVRESSGIFNMLGQKIAYCFKDKCLWVKKDAYKSCLLLLLIMLANNSLVRAQCTSALVNWDAHYFRVNPPSGTAFTVGTNSMQLGYVTTTLSGINTTNTAEASSYGAGADLSFTGNGTVTLTFRTEVQNVKFSLYDIDASQKATISATNAASGAQTVTLSKISGTVLTIVSGTAATATANATAVANTSTDGTVNVDIAGPVKTITIVLSNTAGDYWISDVNACVTGDFPTNYYAVSTPEAGQPDYFLVSYTDGTFYVVNKATGGATLLFTDPLLPIAVPNPGGNSLGYDPYKQQVYYTADELSTNNKTVYRYDLKTCTRTVIIPDVTTLGIQLESGGVGGAGAAFYGGSYYIGIDARPGFNNNEATSFWRIDFDASGNPISPASRFWGVQGLSNGAGGSGNTSALYDISDFVMNNGVFYNNNVGASSVANTQTQHLSLNSDAVIAGYTLSSATRGRSAGVDYNGNVYSITSTATGIRLYDGAGGFGPTTAITGVTGTPAATDASESFKYWTDFGDAPVSYGTAYSSATASCAAPTLRIGAALDYEVNDINSVLTDGDDNNNTGSADDEEGLASIPSLSTTATSYSLIVSVLNNSGSAKTLQGWIDFNGNGTFDNTEYTTVSVPNNAGQQNVTLTWSGLSGLVAGTSYIRLRLNDFATKTNTDDIGLFGIGEVEDYKLDILCTVSTPTIGTTTQPTCLNPGASVVLSGLPSTGTWTINQSGTTTNTITGTGTSTTIALGVGTFTFTVTNSTGCTSSATGTVTITAATGCNTCGAAQATPWLAWFNEIDGAANKATYFGTDNNLVLGSNATQSDYGIGADPRGYVITHNDNTGVFSIVNPITNTTLGTVTGTAFIGVEGFRSWYDKANQKYYFVVSRTGTLSGGTVSNVCDVYETTNPAAPTFHHTINVTWPSALPAGDDYTTHIVTSSDGTALYGVLGEVSGAWFKVTNPFSSSYTATGFTSTIDYNGNTAIDMPQPHMIALDEVNNTIFMLSTKATGLGNILTFNTNGTAKGVIYQVAGATYHGIAVDATGTNLYVGREGATAATNVVYRFAITQAAGTYAPAATSPSLGVAGTDGFVMQVSLTPDNNKLYAYTYSNNIWELNKTTLAAVTTTRASGKVGNTTNTGDYTVDNADPHADPYVSWDFGDAPSTYGTAAHSLNNGYFTNCSLRIGATVDGEGRNFQQFSAASTGDDALNTGIVDDEDGNPVISNNCLSSTITATVPVTNNTGGDAYLVGYIDFNQDGDFNDAGEKSATLTVANGTSGSNVVLTFTPAVSPCGKTVFLRLRLSTSQVAVEKASDASSSATTAFAPDGEVEDYQITFTNAISGNIWNDVNGNAVNAGEPAITSGVWVNLVDPVTNDVIQSVQVDASGNYSFTGLPTNTAYNIILSSASQAGNLNLVSSSLPTGFVNTGTNLNGTANTSNKTGAIAVNTGAAALINQNFGIEQPPTAVNDNATGTLGNAVTVSVLSNDSDPTPGTLDATRGSLITPGGATGITTDAQGDVTGFTVAGQGTWAVNTTTGAITFTPQAGFVGNPTPVNYTVRDNAGFISNQALVTITYPTVNISGTVVNDVNNSATILDGSEIGTTAGTNLYVYLVSGTGVIVDSAKVATNGTYTLQGSPSTAYTLELSTTQYTIGTSGVVAATINNTTPSGWVTTGEGASNTDDGTADGSLTLITGVGNSSSANFGIEQPPTAGTATAPSQVNPGGTTNATVPASTFSGTDPDGIISSLTITSFPSNATSITIGGIMYTSSSFPSAGVSVLTNSSGQPITPISVDPLDGAVTVAISYKVYDNAGMPSANTGMASIPFTTFSISGNVYADADSLANNLVDGAGTNAGGLNAVLIDALTNKVVAVATVSGGGTYNFSGLSGGSYLVEITTATATVGAAPPSVALPPGWYSTGEHLGASPGSDGLPDGLLVLGAQSGAVANANFGIYNCYAGTKAPVLNQ